MWARDTARCEVWSAPATAPTHGDPLGLASSFAARLFLSHPERLKASGLAARVAEASVEAAVHTLPPMYGFGVGAVLLRCVCPPWVEQVACARVQWFVLKRRHTHWCCHGRAGLV